MITEFEFIQNLKEKYHLRKIGDDCAVLPKDARTDMVVTTDMLVEDVDFRLEWTTPEFLGHKALAVSLSDIAAMGADPKWAMLSIGVPEDLWNEDFLERFYSRWQMMARAFNVELIGGDVSRSDKVVIDSVVGGEVARGKAILRSGAKPGESIYLTGHIGGASAGLKLLNDGSRYPSAAGPSFDGFLLKQLAPEPLVATGKWLLEKGFATAMIDVSDGLSSDLNHLCQASGVGAKVRADLIPVSIPADSDLSIAERFERLEECLNGGEDFELLFTSKESQIFPFSKFIRIGETTADAGIEELAIWGQTTILEPKGYRHF